MLRLFLEQIEERGNAQPEIGVPRVEAVLHSTQPPLHQDIDGVPRDRVGPVDQLVGEERPGNGVVVFITGKGNHIFFVARSGKLRYFSLPWDFAFMLQ